MQLPQWAHVMHRTSLPCSHPCHIGWTKNFTIFANRQVSFVAIVIRNLSEENKCQIFLHHHHTTSTEHINSRKLLCNYRNDEEITNRRMKSRVKASGLREWKKNSQKGNCFELHRHPDHRSNDCDGKCSMGWWGKLLFEVVFYIEKLDFSCRWNSSRAISRAMKSCAYLVLEILKCFSVSTEINYPTNPTILYTWSWTERRSVAGNARLHRSSPGDISLSWTWTFFFHCWCSFYSTFVPFPKRFRNKLFAWFAAIITNSSNYSLDPVRKWVWVNPR